MKAFVARIACYWLPALVFCICSCTINPTGFAGGAGAGNPAILTVVANGADSLYAAAMRSCQTAFCPALRREFAAVSTHADTPDTDIIITITDFGKMRIDVNGVYIHARYAAFPLPPGVKAKDIQKPLYCDSHAIYLDGPFVFDLLRGACTPPTPFNLPNGIYRYADLYIGPVDTSGFGRKSPLEYQIIITGKFMFLDTLRNIGIYILCNEKRTFPAIDGGFELSGHDSVELIIGLDEQSWLDSINIKGCINNGVVHLDKEGNLSIYDNPSGTGPDAQLAAGIRSNMFKSGVFRHKHPRY